MKAVYAGSFDPPTVGHEWMIEHGSKLFDELVVAIGINPEKECTFSVEERLEMLKAIAKGFSNVTVAFLGSMYLVHYAKSIGAGCILRGLRSEKDFEDELEMRDANMELDPEIEIVFLIPPQHLRKVSSSFVKALVGYDGWEEAVRRYLPEPVYQRFVERFKDARPKA